MIEDGRVVQRENKPLCKNTEIREQVDASWLATTNQLDKQEPLPAGARTATNCLPFA
jgi:hypothetical protein